MPDEQEQRRLNHCFVCWRSYPKPSEAPIGDVPCKLCATIQQYCLETYQAIVTNIVYHPPRYEADAFESPNSMPIFMVRSWCLERGELFREMFNESKYIRPQDQDQCADDSDDAGSTVATAGSPQAKRPRLGDSQ